MKIALRVGMVYVFGLWAALIGLLVWHDPLWLAIVPVALYGAVMTFYALIPDQWYSQYRVHPTYSMRTITLMRITFMTLVSIAITWLARSSSIPTAIAVGSPTPAYSL
jgi:hypothetical protein